MTDAIVATCPSCGGWVEVSPLREGVEIECPDCEALLTPIALDPPVLAQIVDADNEGRYRDEERRDLPP